ncbi:MAG: serine/threonine protein kinase [Kofleriaceae bacterium]|nr:serine/threonine protein kinase [Kofleriaceae bacterium]
MSNLKTKWPEEEFGDYTVHERLGMGGMATVHRAVHRATGRSVALKRLLPQFATDRELIEQFIRESEIASALAHPNIVEVWEHGKAGKIHFMVMENIDGKSLLSLLRRANEDDEPAPIGVSVHLLREILNALEYATTGLDSAGKPFNIIHRDLSPSNIIITTTGHLKIIDFGVARSLQGRYATNSGHVKGKLGYMSPEILAGRKFDGRSDLFSASVVAWELLTAKRLYRGNEREQLKLRNNNYELTPPSSLNHWVPRELDALLAIALAENPGSRWPSAGAMLDALRPQLREHGQGASREAVRSWVYRLEKGESVRVDTKTSLRSSSDAAVVNTDVASNNQLVRKRKVFNSITDIEAPNVQKFKSGVITTMHEPGYDPMHRHQTSQSSSLALGSSEFPVQQDSMIIADEEQTSSDHEQSISDEPTANSVHPDLVVGGQVVGGQ